MFRKYEKRTEQTTFHVDTGRKLKVHKMFRRRLGCLQNVLCTFNLRPMSTGLQVLERSDFFFLY